MMRTLRVGDLGADYSGAKDRITPELLTAAGMTFVMRYSAGTSTYDSISRFKVCTKDEFKRLTGNGVDVTANSESTTTRITQGAQAGIEDAKVDGAHWNSLGYNEHASIYVSWDAFPFIQSYNAVDEYLHAYDDTLQGYYHPDFYGGRAPMRWLMDRNRIRYGWHANAESWSDYAAPYQPDPATRERLVANPDWTPAHIWQTGNYSFDNGADEDVILRTPIGSHFDQTSPPPPIVTGDSMSTLVTLQGKDALTVLVDGRDCYLLQNNDRDAYRAIHTHEESVAQSVYDYYRSKVRPF